MALLTAQNLARSFGPVDIFDGITLSIPHNARIAIVGTNGVGKTTLLRILAGEDEPSEGTVYRSKGLRVGYLPQVAVHETNGTLWSSCLVAFEELLAMGDELKQLELAMQDPQCDPDILRRYGNLQHRFDLMGGYTYTARIRQTLAGLVLRRATITVPWSSFPVVSAPAPVWRVFCWKILIFSFWTSPATTSISMLSNGWKPTCATGMALWSSFRMTATSSTRPPA